jgi:hypothetical protein
MEAGLSAQSLYFCLSTYTLSFAVSFCFPVDCLLLLIITHGDTALSEQASTYCLNLRHTSSVMLLGDCQQAWHLNFAAVSAMLCLTH